MQNTDPIWPKLKHVQVQKARKGIPRSAARPRCFQILSNHAEPNTMMRRVESAARPLCPEHTHCAQSSSIASGGTLRR